MNVYLVSQLMHRCATDEVFVLRIRERSLSK